MKALRRRVSLKVLGKQNREGDGEDFEVEGIPRPKTRGDCTPEDETVPCPEEGCGAAIGVFCGHLRRRELARAPFRPCPWVSCKWHTYLDVAETGSLVFNFPNTEPWDIPATCVLDVAEKVMARGQEATLEEVGEIVNLTRERIRQVTMRSELALAIGHRELVEPNFRLMRTEALAKRTRFSPSRPARLGPVVVGKCRDCKEQRRKVKGEWRCGCRRAG